MSTREAAENPLSRLVPTSVVAFVLLGFAGMFLRPSYQSPRPYTAAGQNSKSGETGVADALAMEDPLAVAQREHAAAVTVSAALRRVAGVSASRIEEARSASQRKRLQKLLEPATPSCNRPALVLAIWQPGGQWPEDSERRIRTRRATVMALAAAGYSLEYYRALGVTTVKSAIAPGVRVAVAWDGFTPAAADSKHRRVVVLWMDESAQRPALFHAAVDNIAELLGSDLGSRCDLQVVHVGPSSSSAFQDLIADARKVESSSGAEVVFRSPFATAPDKDLGFDPSAKLGRLRISREISTDDGVAALLVGELYERIPTLLASREVKERDRSNDSWLEVFARGIAHPVLRLSGWAAASSSDKATLARVALISEQDSTYGRQWETRMRQATAELRSPGSDSSGTTGVNAPIHFDSIPYIGVIDGVHGDEPAAESRRDAYPVGSGQLDYLQRVEKELAGSSYDAIGIFGTDVYDTLMILQALRPRFPGVLFFTADMDARLAHPDHLPYTRNLIVASHFALQEPRAIYQFRDVYEHSLFRALDRILAPSEVAHCACACAPALFEIGRTNVVELVSPAREPRVESESKSTTSKPTRRRSDLAHDLACALFLREVHADDGNGTDDTGTAHALTWLDAWWMLAGATVLWAGVLVFANLARARSTAAPLSRRALVVLVLSFPGLVLLVCFARLDLEALSRTGTLEPLGLADGVSVWPSIALRLIGIGLCMWFLARIRRRLSELHESVRVRYALFSITDSVRHRRVSLFWLFRTGRGRYLLDDAWRAFGKHVEDVHGFAVRAVLALCTLCFAFLSLSPFDPGHPPVRGITALVLERLTWWSSIAGLFVLVYAVLEASCIANRLVSNINDVARISITRRSREFSASRSARDLVRSHFPLRLKLSAEILEVVDTFVIYPAIVLSVLIIARASFLDAWAWSPLLVVGSAFFVALLLLCSSDSRRAASEARDAALAQLAKARRRLIERPALAELCADLAREVQAANRGPFAPLWRHPLVSSILGPLLTYVSTIAVDPRLLEVALGLRVFS